MQAYLDGSELDIKKLAANATVGEIVDVAKTKLESKDAILIEIACDDRTVSAETIMQTLGRPASNFSRIDCRSGDPREIVIETLKSSGSALVESKSSAQKAAEDLTSGSVAQGMQRLIDCVEIWSQAHEAMVNSGALLKLDFEELVIAEKHIFEWLTELGAKLRDIRGAIENRDHVLLSDILRYEAEEFIEGWERMIDAYVKHVAQSKVAA